MHEIMDIIIIIHTSKRRIYMAQGKKVMLFNLFWH